MFLQATSPSINKKPIPVTRSKLDDLQSLKEAIDPCEPLIFFLLFIYLKKKKNKKKITI